MQKFCKKSLFKKVVEIQLKKIHQYLPKKLLTFVFSKLEKLKKATNFGIKMA